MDLALNNLERSICHKTHQTKQVEWTPEEGRNVVEKTIKMKTIV